MADKKKKELEKAFAAAFPSTIPVLTGFLVLGMAYGVLMHTKGIGILWTTIMSAIAFCGSMQFVAITFFTVAFNPIQAFILSVMVNARHLFYGISMLEKYKGMGKIRGFLIYVLCDETFSIISTVKIPEGVNHKYFYGMVSLLNYIYWVVGSFLGGVLGNFVSFNTKGLDFVLTALFVVLFLEQWKVKANRIPGVIGILSTILSIIVFGKANLVIPAMCIILVALLAGRKKLCN